MSLQPARHGEPTTEFETSAWKTWDTVQAWARQVEVTITREVVDRARWRQFMDPVSLALDQVLQKHACAQVLWNSDGFRPRYAGDDGRIGIHVEIQDDSGLTIREESYWTPLPQRAARAMRKLAREGAEEFESLTMRLKLPTVALA